MEINLKNRETNNKKEIQSLHPNVRELFSKFVYDCENVSNVPVWIYSAKRTFTEQEFLYRRHQENPKFPYAAPAYSSLHVYGMAIDMYVYNGQEFTRHGVMDIYEKISTHATNNGLRWLGATSNNEQHHFDYNQISRVVLREALKNNNLEDGYVIIPQYEEFKLEEKVNDIWSTEIGDKILTTTKEKVLPETPTTYRKVVDIKEQNAVGIWQIIKLVADQYSLSQSINSATIATSQGSLLNYVRNVIQEPWVEFFGDTVGDQYYFQARKQPFDYNGWTKLQTLKTIYEEDVLADDLGWFQGDIYSWYQIIPKGSFLGEQNLIYAQITSVFFEEYAEVWGSKPNSVVSNYLNFSKIRGETIMYEKAIKDLRYMVESGCYLPFTREGTITIKGDTNIKRGYKIFYHPTGEEFYVDAVNHQYRSGENGGEHTTLLQVSRGMKIEFTKAPIDRNSIGYFNLIHFDKMKARNVEVSERISEENKEVFYFEENQAYLISSDAEEIKGQEELARKNNRSLNAVVDIIKNNPKAESFTITGNVRGEENENNKQLALNRARTAKQQIIKLYKEKYKDDNQPLKTKIKLEYFIEGVQTTSGDTGLDSSIPQIDQNVISQLQAERRIALFSMESYIKKSKKEIKTNNVAWKVHDKAFQFFLNRKQFAKP